LDGIQWVTFEDPHVAEVFRSADRGSRCLSKTIVQMLIDGEIETGVVGGADLRFAIAAGDRQSQ
jgi:hypothetical protein